MEEKLKIIDQICEKHPSYGVPHNLSEYTGGMKDSGQWFVRKMLDIDVATLQKLYADILDIEGKPQSNLSPEQQSEEFQQFRKECEERIWYGKV